MDDLLLMRLIVLMGNGNLSFDAMPTMAIVKMSDFERI